VHVEDLEHALSFFNDILGFQTLFRATGYAYIRRETAGIRMPAERCDVPETKRR